ncbi:uncharacterized protein PRCAT00005648001 [Priceomyces carsonii]|uniref:uncharacterized protein n=1 Tax=Priceomyces carsonii TaxID=28549 RepID=UPI002EDAFFAF|nr:unnamed protein product [Priceomyces carsonii]
MLYLTILGLFVHLVACFRAPEIENNLEAYLEAPWLLVPFKLRLIESIASYNESLYLPVVLLVLGILSDSDEIEIFENDVNEVSDHELYTSVFESLNIDIRSKSFVDISLANHVYSPRVEAHFYHYRQLINKYDFSKRLFKECSIDSFGKQILNAESDKIDAWVLFNDKIYCSPEELYALNSFKKKPSMYVDSIDRPIGWNDKAPLLTLYGDVNSHNFAEMFMHLYRSSNEGLVRFVWRYIPSFATSEFERLTGYGAELRLKDSHTYVDETENDKSLNHLKLNENFWEISFSSEVNRISKDKWKSVGLKLASLVLSNNWINVTQFELLRHFLQDLPKFAYYIANSEPSNTLQVESALKYNEGIGSSEMTLGLYVNGSPVNKLELDIFEIISKIKNEEAIINELCSLGLSVTQSKHLIYKFALLSAVKENKFRNGNAAMLGNHNRFKIYEDEFTSDKKRGGVVFFNDIGKDDNYAMYSEDPFDVYLNFASRMAQGRIPPLRLNVHDLIFVLNLGNKEQLRVFFTLSKMILDQGIPQQVGLVPLIGEDPNDRLLADRFYYLVEKASKTEALALLYKYFESKNSEDAEKLIYSVVSEREYNFTEIFSKTLKKFSLQTPSVILNGVIYDLRSPNWQAQMKTQMAEDVKSLRQYLSHTSESHISLKEALYHNANTERNTRIIPLDPNEAKYIKLSKELTSISTPIKFSNLKSADGTVWLVGDFRDQSMKNQLITIITSIESSKYSLKLRLIDTGNSEVLSTLGKQFELNNLKTEEVKLMENYFQNYSDDTKSNEVPSGVLNALRNANIPLNARFALFNSRYIDLASPLSGNDLKLLFDFEIFQRLSIIDEIILSYPRVFDNKSREELNNASMDDFDWLDLCSSLLSKSFHFDDMAFYPDVARYDFSSLNMSNSFLASARKTENKVDILLIMDPVDEYSQKMVSICSAIMDIPFVGVRILFQPISSTDSNSLPNRFYRGLFPSRPKFGPDGRIIENHSVDFDNVSETNSFSLDLDIPNAWTISLKNSPDQLDLNHIQFQEEKLITIGFSLRSLLIEGNAKEITAKFNPAGLILQLSKDDIMKETTVMSNLGYFQFSALPGVWKLSLSSGKSREHFSILSTSDKNLWVDENPVNDISLSITDLKGSHILLMVKKNAGFKTIDLPGYDESSSSFVRYFFKPWGRKVEQNRQADVNIFTIASGHAYERLVAIMIASIREHSDKTLKFWIIEDFLSPQFKELIPDLEARLGVEIELISYKWPKWLRYQKENHRVIWGYKILFLDVLFPPSLKKVIFVDADQISRADVGELLDIDLEGAAYGFPPMCDSRQEMEGFRFWKSGYWSEVLQDDLKYHISALFVVDLVKFKQISAGNRLRSHYQKLSFDPASLANLDQDLPNNMQRNIKIFTLPQDWLWCETWCSDESLSRAKAIDLCNNPTSNESKIDKAKRLLPEWKHYEAKIQSIIDTKDEISVSSLSVTTKIRSSGPDIKSTDISEVAFDNYDEL